MTYDPKYDTLTKNMTAIFGKKGQSWLTRLPTIVETLTSYWKLTNLIPVDNMTFNYVAKATLQTRQPVVLKISNDIKSFENERQALQFFNGEGSVQLIDFHEKYHALLLQQAIPGTTLKSLYTSQPEYVMDRYVQTMQTLHHKALPKKHTYSHIHDWLQAIDRLTPNHHFPSKLLNKAIDLKNNLLASMTDNIFLHGDLHHDNILQNGNQWLAIDPKGVIGEQAFEIAAFDFMYVSELANSTNLKPLFDSRVAVLAHKANLDQQRIKDWVFVRLILMAAWLIEDNGNPSWALKLAEQLSS